MSLRYVFAVLSYLSPTQKSWKHFIYFALFAFLLPHLAFAQHKGISFQAVLKKPDGTYPNAVGVAVTLQVLDPATDCVLREELHTGVQITNGYLNLVLGSASATTPGPRNPSPVLSVTQVMDNSTTRTGLNCVDSANTIVSSNQTYVPASTHARKLRLRATVAGDQIVADFNIRAVGFAVNAENLEGKSASAFVQTSAAITQPNVESIFSRYSVLDSILSGTFAGNAATATALAVAPGACGAGQYISAMSANGSITCGTPTAGTGTVTSISSANSYLSVSSATTTPVLTLNVGTAANTVAAGNDSRFSDSRAPNGTAGGDLSGSYPNPTVAKIAGKSVVLTTPAAGEVLKYDGTNFVNATPSGDSTKLPLAGGTMAGAIDMGSQNLTSLGFATMSANKSLHVSNNVSDPTGLSSADKGKMWFNSTSNTMMYWNGSAAQSMASSGLGGSGTTNAIPRFTASATIGDSGLSDNGTNITASRAIVSTPTGIPTGATINLATSNTHLLSNVGGSVITLQNLVHGGEYNIIIADTTSRTYTFSGCTNSYFKPANAATTNGTQTIYGLLVYQSGATINCYITWSSGFQ